MSCIFFFKQKTAYEKRISDWSSDVCSSDLTAGRIRPKMIGSGSLRTNRNRPVSTSTLTRILVPKPKKAFQSPGVHQGSFAGPGPVVETLVMMQTPLLERFRGKIGRAHV